jgi:hypothetical protein
MSTYEKCDPSEELRAWGLEIEDPKGWIRLYEAAMQAAEESGEERAFAE